MRVFLIRELEDWNNVRLCKTKQTTASIVKMPRATFTRKYKGPKAEINGFLIEEMEVEK